MDLTGKTAIVTGAGTGVGRATALRLATLGCDVVVNYRSSSTAAAEVAALVEKTGRRAVVHQTDVSCAADVAGLVDRARVEFGRLDVLVNNAGTTEFIPFDQFDALTDDVWNRILGVNLVGPFRCAAAAAELMRQSADPAGAEIVNVSSVAGSIGSGSSIPYCASKAALNNLTIALARTLAPQIRVNAVAPGFIKGQWLERGLGDRYETMTGAFEQAMPLKQVCTPDDVAAAIVSLITGSDLVTGQILTCDAGMSIVPPVKP